MVISAVEVHTDRQTDSMLVSFAPRRTKVKGKRQRLLVVLPRRHDVRARQSVDTYIAVVRYGNAQTTCVPQRTNECREEATAAGFSFGDTGVDAAFLLP